MTTAGLCRLGFSLAVRLLVLAVAVLPAMALLIYDDITQCRDREASQDRCRVFVHWLDDALEKRIATDIRRLVPSAKRVAQRAIATRHRIVLKEDQMETTDVVVAVFADHQAAETAVKKLTVAGVAMKNLSVVGKGFHTDEKVVGFYNIGDRVKFWGTRGAFWGGLWGLFFGGLFMTVPVIGHVIVLGYLAAMAISAVESAVVYGGLSALGAALYSIGIPKDSVLQYETAIKADSFLVMAHGTAEEVARAKAILGTANPTRLDVHAILKAVESADRLVHKAG